MRITRRSNPLMLILMLGLAVMAACDDSESPVASELLVDTELILNDGEVPAETRIPDGVVVSLRFTTIGDEDVAFDFVSSCMAGYEVLSGDQVVMAYPNGCAGEPASLTIRSIGVTGLRLSVPVVRVDMDSMEYGSWLYEGDRLAPGEYTVRAGLLDNEQSVAWPSATFEVLDER